MEITSILWFFAGWISAAITPLMTESFRFLAIVVRSEGKRREMVQKARNIANGRFRSRQNHIRNALGGVDNDNEKN